MLAKRKKYASSVLQYCKAGTIIFIWKTCSICTHTHTHTTHIFIYCLCGKIVYWNPFSFSFLRIQNLLTKLNLCIWMSVHMSVYMCIHMWTHSYFSRAYWRTGVCVCVPNTKTFQYFVRINDKYLLKVLPFFSVQILVLCTIFCCYLFILILFSFSFYCCYCCFCWCIT